jgi:RNA polymerase sigma factor (TIGR02999 family)
MSAQNKIPETPTELLSRWSQGDESALDQLTPLVYDELRRLAGRYLRRERPDHTLQATALVNETFIKLCGAKEVAWQSRAHFVGVAARLMRRILVDYAREHFAQKRGGEMFKLPSSRADRVPMPHDLDLVALDEALKTFIVEYPRQAQVVELLFFGGLSTQETADVLNSEGIEIAQRTVERDWKFARSWLLREISRV